MNLFSKTAKYELVIENPEALEYHVMKYEMGFRYPLSLACYQYRMLQREKEARS